MAQKRMFDKSITNSDDFREMPASTQNLYFHFNMNADDDGFLNNWRGIMKILGAREDDLKLLIAKSYIIPFETGVIVIKHWQINNFLRKDRHINTKYQEELSQLTLNDNKEYCWLTNVQPSIDKNSIEYNSYSSNNNIIIENNIKDINRIKEEKENIKEKEENIYEYIEVNFKKTLTPIEIQKIQEWLDIFSEDIIKYAVEIAVMSRKCNFKYVDGILKNWKSNDLNTLEEIKQENKSVKSDAKKVELFDYDWLNDEDNS